MSITRKKRSIVDLAIKKKHIAGLGDVYIKRPRRVIAYEPPTKEELKKEIDKSVKPKYKVTINEPPREAERYKDVSVEYFVGERVKELTGEIAHNLKNLQKLAMDVYEYQVKIDQLKEDMKDASKRLQEANERLEGVIKELAQKKPRKVGEPYKQVKEWEKKLQDMRNQLNLLEQAFTEELRRLIKEMEHYNVRTLITDIKKAEEATAEVSQKLELTVKLGAAPTGKIVKKRLERVLSDIRAEIEQRLGKETYEKIADLLNVVDILLKSMGTLIYVTLEMKLREIDGLLAQVQEMAEREQQQQEVSASIKLAFSWSALKAKIVGIFNGLIDYLKDAWEKVKTLFHKKEEAEKTLEEYTKRMKQYADELDQILAEAQSE